MISKITLFLSLFAFGLSGAFAQNDIIASDDFDSPLNLTSRVTDLPVAVGDPVSTGDCWGILTSTAMLESNPPYDSVADIPFPMVDESLVGFPTDNQGVVSEFKPDRYLGFCDLINSNTQAINVTGELEEIWSFDISGASTVDTILIDAAAMGDFEGGDVFDISWSIDGSPYASIFSGAPDEAINFTYTMASGTMNTLNDPMQLNGVTLYNAFVTFKAPISGAGAVLNIKLAASQDAANECVAFDNLVVKGTLMSVASVPTMSEWGLIVLGILLMISATLAIRRRFGFHTVS
jgi:hypothetical protein